MPTIYKNGIEYGGSGGGVTGVKGNEENSYRTGNVNLTPANIGAQEELVSGTNIKTINNESILGSGNITISSGTTYTAGTGIDITNNVISIDLPLAEETGF